MNLARAFKLTIRMEASSVELTRVGNHHGGWMLEVVLPP